MKHVVIIIILVIASTFLIHTGLTNIGLLPLEASAQAVEIDQLFGIHIWLISALFSLIMVVLLYSLIVFRRKKGETGDGAYIPGNSTLEVLWTAIPLLAVIVLAYIGGSHSVSSGGLTHPLAGESGCRAMVLAIPVS